MTYEEIEQVEPGTKLYSATLDDAKGVVVTEHDHKSNFLLYMHGLAVLEGSALGIHAMKPSELHLTPRDAVEALLTLLRGGAEDAAREAKRLHQSADVVSVYLRHLK